LGQPLGHSALMLPMPLLQDILLHDAGFKDLNTMYKKL